MASSIPASTPVVDANGNITQSWNQFLSSLSTGATSSQVSDISTATSPATSAQTAANSALSQISALNSLPSLFFVGDYVQSARTPAQMGSAWLVCDGSSFLTSSYPSLETVLSGITAPGATSGTRKLPLLPMTYDEAHPSGPPIVSWYIRAQ